MSKVITWIIVLLVVAALGAGLWWSGFIDPWLAQLGLTPAEEEVTEVGNETERQTQPQSELTTGANTSDQALGQDAAALDAQMEAYGQASSDLDSSLNDQPVVQDANF